ncbi:unnamed protein product [Mytilus coruscus]|uniref:Ig-like domain-containing protein n=1 Tax=Mytilus coruscus TaxID=42192 RepID=A0A6J8DIP6_MYTCO|nr:unnamed protein product [Mytilus coruscus]
MSVIMKHHFIEMSAVFVFFFLISTTYCEKLLVEKHTTVEIACPFTPKSWYYDASTLIAFGRDVHPKYTSTYSITDTCNLKIFDFTDADQGPYMCQEVLAGEYQQHTVIVNLCNIPEKISYLSYETNQNSSGPERNILCTVDTITQYSDHIYYKAVIGIFKIQTIQQTVIDRNKETINGSLMVYKCLTLNADKCVINNNTFQLKVEWISSYEKTKKTQTNETQVYVYTCKCNVSNMEENLQCNKTFKIYYSNKTMYLRDSKNVSTGYYECAIDENDAFQNIILSSDMELVRNFQGYLLIGVSIVCGMVLIGVFSICIMKVLNKVKNNAENIVRHHESQNLPMEGYSSIERRRRIQVGQKVSYTASRVSRSSTSNERGHGLVEEPAVIANGTRNQKPGVSNGNQTLQEPFLRNQTNRKTNTETHILNYIEVQFNNDTMSPKFHIHGSENRTSYADIDISIKAANLVMMK